MALTKTERIMEAAILEHQGDAERVLVIERAKRFKRSWIELAEVLTGVREHDTWRRWGFASFDDYCARELHLRKGTVDKLCASYGFLRTNAPRLLRDEAQDDVELKKIPSWQAVDFVARAEERGAASDEVMAEMKRAVFDEGAPMPVLSRKYREVAFPVDDEEKRSRLRAQIAAAARRLADLVTDEEAGIPDRMVRKIEEAIGELVQTIA
jgi:hypothetical protein